MSKQSFADNTYSLAKGLHHLQISKEYLELIRIDTSGELKQLFGHHINKIEFVINNISDRLTPESRAILKEELSDSPCIDAINDNLVHLTNEQRLMIEKITDAMKKGEDMYITSTEK